MGLHSKQIPQDFIDSNIEADGAEYFPGAKLTGIYREASLRVALCREA